MVTEPTITTSIPNNGHDHSVTRKTIEWSDLAFARRTGAEDIWLTNTNSSIPRDLTEKVHIQRSRIANIYQSRAGAASDLLAIDKQVLSPYKGATKIYVQVRECTGADMDAGYRKVIPNSASLTIEIPDDPDVAIEFIRQTINRLSELTYEYVSSTVIADRLEAMARGSLAPIIA